LQVLSGGSWKLVDANLAYNELVLPGQALVEASAGYFEAAHHRVVSKGHSRYSMAFKCIPRQESTFHRGPIMEANPALATGSRFKRVLPVAAYMADFESQHTSVNRPKMKRVSAVSACRCALSNTAFAESWNAHMSEHVLSRFSFLMYDRNNRCFNSGVALDARPIQKLMHVLGAFFSFRQKVEILNRENLPLLTPLLLYTSFSGRL
jgi:hypothetical protein